MLGKISGGLDYDIEAPGQVGARLPGIQLEFDVTDLLLRQRLSGESLHHHYTESEYVALKRGEEGVKQPPPGGGEEAGVELKFENAVSQLLRLPQPP